MPWLGTLVGIEIVVQIGEKEHFMDLHREQLEIAFTKYFGQCIRGHERN